MESFEIYNFFLPLIRAGLWEENVHLESFSEVNLNEIQIIAERQSVVGLLAAGLDHVVDIKYSKEALLNILGSTLQIENRNTAMNFFIGVLFKKLEAEGLCALLVKGQGVAQCYERPLWRTSGDVDLLVDEQNYKKVRDFLTANANSVDVEIPEMKHQAMIIGPWEVELHGSLHGLWSYRVDCCLDKLQKECFEKKAFRIWDNNGTTINIPSIDYDILFVFTHILQHFFRGGLGLRQICDLTRLMWYNHNEVNVDFLNCKLKEMGLLSEWKTIASLSVNYLGMPADTMPLYSPSYKWNRKANSFFNLLIENKIQGFSSSNNDGLLTRKCVSLRQHLSDFIHTFNIFPLDSIKVLFNMVCNGFIQLVKGK